MLQEWQRWCRFCAKDDSTDTDTIYKIDSVADQMELVNKHFMISMLPFDGSLTSMCGDCCGFLAKLKGFNERCLKAEKMFRDLMTNKTAQNLDLRSLRIKFGIEKEEIRYLQQPNAAECSVKEPVAASESFPDPLDSDEVEESIEVKQETVTTRRSGRQRKVAKAPVKQIKVKNENQSNGKCPDVDEKSEKGDEASEYEPEDENEANEDGNARKKKRIRYKEKKYSCTMCTKTYARPHWLRDHILQEHKPEEMTHSCSTCSKRFPTQIKLRLHESIHLPEDKRRTFQCPYCEKKFGTKGIMQTHITFIHSNEKPFVCEECGKAFKTKSALKEHHVSHSNDRAFQCSSCPKTYKSRAKLKRHEDTHKDVTYDCLICGVKRKTKATLMTHMLVHSDVKKYKCSYCGNEYKRSTALKDHLILHTGQRPFECPFCDKTFANNSNCRNHKKKEHPNELAALEASSKEGKEGKVVTKIEKSD